MSQKGIGVAAVKGSRFDRHLGKEKARFWQILISNVKECNSLSFTNSDASGHHAVSLNEWRGWLANTSNGTQVNASSAQGIQIQSEKSSSG